MPQPQAYQDTVVQLGQRVNVARLGKLLGMAPRSFYKKCKGQIDMLKFRHPRSYACPQSMIVDQFSET